MKMVAGICSDFRSSLSSRLYQEGTAPERSCCSIGTVMSASKVSAIRLPVRGPLSNEPLPSTGG